MPNQSIERDFRFAPAPHADRWLGLGDTARLAPYFKR